MSLRWFVVIAQGKVQAIFGSGLRAMAAEEAGRVPMGFVVEWFGPKPVIGNRLQSRTPVRLLFTTKTEVRDAAASYA